MAAEPIAFARNPADAFEGLIDYKTKEGIAVYQQAIAPLKQELFDCTANGLYGFIEDVKDRANQMSWTNETYGIMMIPNDPAQPFTGGKNLASNYGEISLEAVRAFEETYLSTPTRAAQDADMLYHCLMKSLSDSGKAKIHVWRAQFTVNGILSGNLLFKVIIRESHLDTNATAFSIRCQLSSLDTYIPKIGYDIDKFNIYVMSLVTGLNARGRTIYSPICSKDTWQSPTRSSSPTLKVKRVNTKKERQFPLKCS